MSWPLWAGILLGTVACGTTASPVFLTCESEAELGVTEAGVGDTVTVHGGPFVQADNTAGEPARTTVVTVGGASASVLEVSSTNRDGEDVTEDCDLCEECRIRSFCNACGLCDGRLLPLDDTQDAPGRRTCFGDVADLDNPDDRGACGRCEQRIVFTVPKVAAGPQPLEIITSYGTAQAVSLNVVGTDGDSGTTDTASTDTAAPTDTATSTP